jgi:DeoR family glycerol-3-phosphate regulon repressor
MVQVATLSQIDRLFTDAEPPAPFPTLLNDADIRLEVCT